MQLLQFSVVAVQYECWWNRVFRICNFFLIQIIHLAFPSLQVRILLEHFHERLGVASVASVALPGFEPRFPCTQGWRFTAWATVLQHYSFAAGHTIVWTIVLPHLSEVELLNWRLATKKRFDILLNRYDICKNYLRWVSLAWFKVHVTFFFLNMPG